MNMKPKRFTAPAIALAAALAALASGTPATADSFETTTLATPVPAERNGSITVRACATCPLKLVRLDATSTFRIGNSEVDHEQFLRFIATGGERYLNVSYDASTGLVKRLRVPGRLATRPERGAR